MEDDATAAGAADAVSKVLGEDNLLEEILLRVGFPTTLVRAAAVCKRWLHHTSDKAFLRRFRKLNPPRILGFYVEGQGSPRFVPLLPQPPELAAAVRIAGGYNFGAGNDRVFPLDCRNGSVFSVLCFRGSLVLHSPLCPERAMATDPPPLLPYLQQLYQDPDYFQQPYHTPENRILSREEKDGGLSYFYVVRDCPTNEDITSPTNFRAQVYMLKDGVWVMHTLAATQIPHWKGGFRAVLVDNKIYMTPTFVDITVLDLKTSSISTIQLPELVNFMISPSDDASSLYLIRLHEFQLRIWLLNGDNSWSIVDTICLQEMFANLMMSDCRVKDVDTSNVLLLNHVGDNAEFVLFEIGRLVLYLDIRCRTLRTLYAMS